MDQRNELPCFFQVSVTCSGIQCMQGGHNKPFFAVRCYLVSHTLDGFRNTTESS